MEVIVESLHSLVSLVGREVAATDWFSVTQERMQRFAEITEDSKWIHVDTKRAKCESPYGTTVAHGFLTLSLLSQFMRKAVQIRTGFRLAINYGLNRVRFPNPVRSGDEIRARF